MEHKLEANQQAWVAAPSDSCLSMKFLLAFIMEHTTRVGPEVRTEVTTAIESLATVRSDGQLVHHKYLP